MIKVALVENHGYLREYLVERIKQHEKFELVWSCSDGDEVLPLLRTNQVDVMVIDIELDRMNGDKALTVALKEFPGLKALAYTMNQNFSNITYLISIGFYGFLCKADTSLFDLYKAIEMVAGGEKLVRVPFE